ncbi:MAG: 4-hydroxythreonine-4-phosphate dehydrogenase PdxA [Planctomycetales bacterium]|nr:4-hydroxythreonine-4-phosphate dehydrogenase PdxA [Planctomycetales bacterium]
MSVPKIAVTMGDPAGVGPEICLRILENPTILEICQPLIFGDSTVLAKCAALLTTNCSYPSIESCDWPEASTQIQGPAIVNFQAADIERLRPGVISADTGKAAYTYLTAAIDAALAGHVAAITTAPINKEALHAAGINFPGHTEILADRTKTDRYCMLQFSDEVTASFVTTHVGYREVPDLLSIERIVEVIQISYEAVRRIRGGDPKIVVCGLNPHAGENGLFGDGEEERFIKPAIEQARKQGIVIDGPLPPDTAFLPNRRIETGCFVCMYHDQGHIPLKALAFDTAVNVTLGLPIVRTSVDHGTANDIAWKGIANPSSLVQAITLATRLAAK